MTSGTNSTSMLLVVYVHLSVMLLVVYVHLSVMLLVVYVHLSVMLLVVYVHLSVILLVVYVHLSVILLVVYVHLSVMLLVVYVHLSVMLRKPGCRFKRHCWSHRLFPSDTSKVQIRYVATWNVLQHELNKHWLQHYQIIATRMIITIK
jgi:hypothetical protein